MASDFFGALQLGPIIELDNLKDNEIVISFAQGGKTDPRMDSRLIDRLRADGKIE